LTSVKHHRIFVVIILAELEITVLFVKSALRLFHRIKCLFTRRPRHLQSHVGRSKFVFAQHHLFFDIVYLKCEELFVFYVFTRQNMSTISIFAYIRKSPLLLRHLLRISHFQCTGVVLLHRTVCQRHQSREVFEGTC